MATWDDILSHYSFVSNTYLEKSDPADLRKPFVDVVPNHPIPAFRPDSNCFLHHEYQHILSPIFPSTETFYYFPVSVELTYLDIFHPGDNISQSLSDHSDFVKMHMHNAWLLIKNDLTICFPQD